MKCGSWAAQYSDGTHVASLWQQAQQGHVGSLGRAPHLRTKPSSKLLSPTSSYLNSRQYK